jgi:hypothetical protein
MILRRSPSEIDDQPAISERVRPHPAQRPVASSILQTLMQGVSMILSMASCVSMAGIAVD